MVNKQGQTRLAQYYGQQMAIEERSALESEIVRKCLARSERVCSFLDYEGYRIIYRRYASLFFIVGISNSEETASSINELSILEFIHTLVETLDKYFESVCELDVRFSWFPHCINFVVDHVQLREDSLHSS